MDYRENYKLWLEEKSLDPKLRAELEAIADDPREPRRKGFTRSWNSARRAFGG